MVGHEALHGLSAERLQAVLRPKVQGAWVLHVLTQALPLETWVYPFAELPPALQQLILDDEGPVPEIALVFASDPRHTDLIDGEKYLKMAARASVQR